MKLFSRLVLAALFFVSAFAAEPRDDSQLIQGTWVPAQAVLAGQAMPEPFLASITLKLTDGKYEALIADRADRGSYKLDTKASPKGMVIVGTDGPNLNKSLPAIYELDGDTLRVCYDVSGTNRPSRPTEFKSTTSNQLFLVTYRRKKS